MSKNVLKASAPALVGLLAALSMEGRAAVAAQRPLFSPATTLPIARTFQYAVRRYTIGGKTINILTGPPTASGGFGLAPGLGGQLWYTLQYYSGSYIASMTTTGKATLYSSSNTSNPYGIVQDGSLMWFTEEAGSYRFGSITANGGITPYAVPNSPSTSLIALGPDKRLWFGVSPAQMAAATTSGVVSTYPLPSGYDSVIDVAPGPDGNVWYATSLGIGKITPQGKALDYNIGFATSGIVKGADGNMWFTSSRSSEIGHITTSGTGLTTFTLGISGLPNQIVTGPDGNEYFTEYIANTRQAAVAQITPSGKVTEYALPYGFNPQSIAVGSDKNIWTDDANSDQLGQLILPKKK